MEEKYRIFQMGEMEWVAVNSEQLKKCVDEAFGGTRKPEEEEMWRRVLFIHYRRLPGCVVTDSTPSRALAKLLSIEGTMLEVARAEAEAAAKAEVPTDDEDDEVLDFPADPEDFEDEETHG